MAGACTLAWRKGSALARRFGLARMSAEVLQAVVGRVRAATGTHLAERDCVALALASALEDGDVREHACHYLTSPRNADAVLKNKAVAMSDREFKALVTDAPDYRVAESGATVALQSPSFLPYEAKMRAALRCTLEEKSCNEAWKKPLKRLSFYYAMHKEADSNPACNQVSLLLGSFVEADRRRVEELQFDVQQTNATHVLCPCLLVLALCATGGVGQR